VEGLRWLTECYVAAQEEDMSWRGFRGSSGSGREGVTAYDGRKGLLAPWLFRDDIPYESAMRVERHTGFPAAQTGRTGSLTVNHTVRAFVMLVASAFLMIGCPGPQETVGAPRPDPTVVCWERVCTFALVVTESSNPLAKQLGCGPEYKYTSNRSRVSEGIGSFCPDSPDNRKVLHDHKLTGYLPGYCDTCLKVPAGQIFVFWFLWAVDPSCTSTCGNGPAPAPI